METDRRIPLFLVCAPFGSGSSVLTQIIIGMGLYCPGPFWQTLDRKTPNSFETESFRDLLLSLVSQEHMRRIKSSPEIVAALTSYRDTVIVPDLASKGLKARSPVLKHALTALILRELSAVFKLRIVTILRPLAEIENSRLRRKWEPVLGRLGASKVYGQTFAFLVNNDSVPFLVVRYNDLLNDPAPSRAHITAFIRRHSHQAGSNALSSPETTLRAPLQ